MTYLPSGKLGHIIPMYVSYNFECRKIKNLFELLPEPHQNQHRVQILQDKQPGHQRSMAEGITHEHIHCHVLLNLERIQKFSE